MIFDELRAIQLRYGYLPKADLEALSERTQTPLYQIHSVASFYPHFHLAPPAKAEVRVCDDMSCHLNGSCELRAELLRRFSGLRLDEVRMKDVSCLGRCDQAPAVAVNDEIYVQANADKVEGLARRDLVRKQTEPLKYIVCNADESEPGTIKDRFILSHLPHLVAEGMAIAGLVTGAKKGILYIRHEYPLQEEIFVEELSRCGKSGVLGRKILGSDLDFELEVFVSPGGYICGEESALIEAIEGHRAEPRNKPPFPGQMGLWQKPTVINNVETFANVPQILARGVEWFKSAGVGGSRGLKFVGVSGQVENPGVFEVPMGTAMSDVIFGHAGGVRGGKKLKAFAPSGPSSGYLPASLVDVKLAFKALADAGSMLGSGAIVVCDESTCMLDMALNAVKFYRNESCGKCVPCRMGSQKMVEILSRWTQGGLSNAQFTADLKLVDDLSAAMSQTSICGLGQIVPAPIQSVLKHFRTEVETHVLLGDCPSGICFSAANRLTELPRVGIRP